MATLILIKLKSSSYEEDLHQFWLKFYISLNIQTDKVYFTFQLIQRCLRCAVVRVEVQRPGDPCVPISNPTVGCRCWFFGWDRLNWGPMLQ
jgi:hypothetical protein